MKRTFLSLAVLLTMSLAVAANEFGQITDAHVHSGATKTRVTLTCSQIKGTLDASECLLVIDGKVHRPNAINVTESNGERYLGFTFDKLDRTDGATLVFLLNGEVKVLKINSSSAAVENGESAGENP